MEKVFEKRIRTYILISMLFLVALNSLAVMRLLDIVDGYIEANGEYAAVELKDTYEKSYDLQTYYMSNSSEYNRYFLEEWYIIIASLYDEVKDNSEKSQAFYTYLNEVESSTNLSIAIYKDGLDEVFYPNNVEGKTFRMVPIIPSDVLNDLHSAGNVLFENRDKDTLLTTKIMKMQNGDNLLMTLKGDYTHNDTADDSLSKKIVAAFNKYHGHSTYYVVNSANEVVLSGDMTLQNKVLDIKDEASQNLMTYLGDGARRVYRDTFYVNQKMFTDSSFYLLPLSDGNRLILIVDESVLSATVNKITFIAILITFIGVVVLYFIGTVMIYIVERYNLTAHRIANSNQVNRMIIVIFAILMLLNGMAIVQINKVVFTHTYSKAALGSLEHYAEMVEEREDKFKEFVSMTRRDAVIQSAFIYKGMKLIEGDLYIPQHTLKEVASIEEITSVDRDIKKSIDEKGYFEYYQGPKLFRKDDFDTFYENYVLEQQRGEEAHAIHRNMIYPSLEGNGFVILSKDIGKQMDILYSLRKEFKDICRPDENEIFVSNIVVYNDTGLPVISNDQNEKFQSIKLKDELTGYPLWYWYQFKHNEFFRTVVKTIDGTYKENYSLVYYQKDYEYYFVYTVPRKVIFEEMEQLYNLYVSAMMFLLVSVFLTLGIRIRIKRKE